MIAAMTSVHGVGMPLSTQPMRMVVINSAPLNGVMLMVPYRAWIVGW